MGEPSTKEPSTTGAKLEELVPSAAFIEDVNAFVKGRPVEEALRELRESHQKYKYIEQEVVQRRRRLSFKLPEIQKCLAAVELLIKQRDEGTEAQLDFSLSSQVFARAVVSDVSGVHLWLGAGVMLEYGLEDAQGLLEAQLAGCRRQLEVVKGEVGYIKDQLTTTEVSIARVYNYDVMLRRAAEGKGKS